MIYLSTNSYLSTNTPTWHLPTCPAYRAEAKLTGEMTPAKLTDTDSTQTQGQYTEDI